MSGNVAEALLGASSKKVPLLPPPPKVKKDPKTFYFDLALPESNEQTYPEFSWAELVRNAKQKEITKKADTGKPVLDPFASDDEDDLKAMAAKFEAKYNSVTPIKKKKRRAEDFIDRGAGYDETDPFIDNSDIYDEVVPPDLQTKHGGFYINSGSLDFKELELSEDEEDSLSKASKEDKMSKTMNKQTPTVNSSADVVKPKVKNPVGRPPGSVNKTPHLPNKVKVPKKRKLIISPVGPDGNTIVKSVLNASESHAKLAKTTPGFVRLENTKFAKPLPPSSSSSSSSDSSSSDDSSSSSESDSSSPEEKAKDKLKDTKTLMTTKPKLLKPVTKPVLLDIPVKQPVPISTSMRVTDESLSMVTPTPLPKRLKTKNVPLNPKLHPNLATASSSMPSPTNLQLKTLNREFLTSNGSTGNLTPRIQSPSVATSSPVSIPSPSLKLPTSKVTTSSSGLTISPVTNSTGIKSTHPSPSISAKQKINTKQASNTPPLTAMDIFQTISNYPNLAALSANFPVPITSNPSLLKSGMNVNPQKNLPNLKKLTPPQEKMERQQQQKQTRPVGQKPLKPKVKPSQAAIGSLTQTNAINSSPHSYLGGYKGPPPLAGPGVELSKSKTPSPHISSNSVKSVSNPRSLAANSLSLNSVSGSNLSIPSQISTLASSNFSTILNSNSIVNSIPSSLTVQRLTQSVTISPTSSVPFPGSSNNNERISGSINRNNLQLQSPYSVGLTDIRPVKHNSAYDVSSLLQNTSGGFPSSVITMASSVSKVGLGKMSNNVDNMPTRKQ